MSEAPADVTDEAVDAATTVEQAGAETVDASTFTKVRLVAPRTRVDIALPNDISFTDLMPHLLDLIGERASDDEPGGWVLTTLTGAPLDVDATLASLGLLDGTSLRLRPGLELVDPPVYDDVVDAVAATVEDELDRRDPALLIAAGASVVALVTASAALAFLGGPIAAAVAGVGAMLALIISAQATRGAHLTRLGTAISLAAVPLLFTTGMIAVPGRLGWPHVLTGLVAALLGSVIARLATGIASSAYTAAHTVLILWTGAAVAGSIWGFDITQVSVVVAGCAVVILAVTPWLAVRLARLPMPLVPETSADLQDFDPRAEVAMAPGKAREGLTYLNGLHIGSTLAAASCAIASVLHGHAWAVAFAAVTAVAVLLRTRFIPDARARTTTAALAVLGMAAAIVTALWFSTSTTIWVLVALLMLLGLGGALGTALAPGRRMTPVTARFVNITEGVATALVFPFGLAALGLFSYVRGLGHP